MSTVADEVYDGTRCAICEERFRPGEDWRTLWWSGDCVHEACWEGER